MSNKDSLRRKAIWLSLVVWPLLTLAAKVQADTLNWGPTGQNATWTPGATVQAFNINGVTVTITITGSDFINGSPATSNDVSGNTNQNSLELEVQHQQLTESVTVRIEFSQPVTNVTIPLYDIDRYSLNGGDWGYADQIRTIRGRIGSGSYSQNPSALTATGIDNQIRGLSNPGGATGNITANTVINGIGNSGPNNDNSANGDASISFNYAVTGISFVYGNINNSGFDYLTEQRIGIGDITFTKFVPESGATLAGVFLALGAFCVRRRKPEALSP